MALTPDSARLADYLTGVFHEPMQVVGLRSLGGETIENPKGSGS